MSTGDNIFLRELKLIQFRNYLSQQFHFDHRIIGISGKNGSGKTNLLDAIHYLCFTKSYFSRTDSSSVLHDHAGWRIDGVTEHRTNVSKISCVLRENNKKEFLLNGEAYKRLSEHIGKYPAVMIAPDDVELITGSSEERRRYMDTLLSQLSTEYLTDLIHYNKLLQQRNTVLKAAAENDRLDPSLLETLDEQLAEKGDRIFQKRSALMQELIPLVQAHYAEIAGGSDAVELQYDSQLKATDLLQLLRADRSRDLYLQRTGSGIHKDDIEFFLKKEVFKSIASQGQRKSLLFALKLAEFDILKKQKGFAPLLLLDDVFEKLDEERMFNLLSKVCIRENAQVFITDTHSSRLKEKFEQLSCEYQIIEL